MSVNAIFIGGPFDGMLRSLRDAGPEFHYYMPPERISLSGPPESLDQMVLPRIGAYRRVRWIPEVAAVYWHGPEEPDSELLMSAMERVLPTK